MQLFDVFLPAKMQGGKAASSWIDPGLGGEQSCQAWSPPTRLLSAGRCPPDVGKTKTEEYLTISSQNVVGMCLSSAHDAVWLQK